MGNNFLTSCMHTGDISRAALDAVDAAKHALEEHDTRYNTALDRLEVSADCARMAVIRNVLCCPRIKRETCSRAHPSNYPLTPCINLQDEDQRARFFHFRRQRTEILWQQIHSVDMDDLVANVNVAVLDAVSDTACS